MSRTLKNGKREKYNLVSKYGGGNVTNEDRFSKIRENRNRNKKQRQKDKKECLKD